MRQRVGSKSVTGIGQTFHRSYRGFRWDGQSPINAWSKGDLAHTKQPRGGMVGMVSGAKPPRGYGLKYSLDYGHQTTQNSSQDLSGARFGCRAR